MPVVLRVVAAVVAVLLIAIVLWDAFETVVLPRRVSRRFRLARLYFRGTWRAWSAVMRRLPSLERREAILAVYGPIAILLLLAFWVFLLIFGYALLLWGLGSPVTVTLGGSPGIGTDLYYSGTTFLTLGLGDVIPHAGPARAVAVVEVGTGFGMLALVIGYLPVIYQAFSRRETRIALLDGHAGSPPTAGALLLRHPPNRRARRLTGILADWETWSSELLETHISYPVLAYYRSQHENQSWVAALTMILDACTLTLTCRNVVEGGERAEYTELAEQAAFTFAMARHAAVDLAQVFHTPRVRLAGANGRLPPDERAYLRDILMTVGGRPRLETGNGDGKSGDDMARQLDDLRALYEPYLEGLAEYLLMDLPPWAPTPDALDDWQTTADNVTAPSVAALVEREHRAQAKPSATPSHSDGKLTDR